MRIRDILAAFVALGFSLAVVSSVYADHTGRFRGQGGTVVEIGLIVWTVVGALLGFVALVAAVRWWERRDEAAAQRAQEMAGQKDDEL